MKKRIAGLLLIITTVGLASCNDVLPPSEGEEHSTGDIIYTEASPSRDDSIRVISADGKTSETLAPGFINAKPSKSFVVFIDMQGTAINIMNFAGQVLHSFTPTLRSEEVIEPLSLGISPDGSKIVYSIHNLFNDTRTLYITNIDGSNPVLISSAFGYETTPCFSPDSRRIAYYETYDLFDVPGNGAIKIASTNGDPVDTRLTAKNISPNHDAFGTIAWSQDGKKIAFGSQDSIMVTSVDSGGAYFLANGYLPDWSPDGQQIAYSDDAFNLHVINKDRSGDRTLSMSPFTGDLFAQWSFDGKEILVTTYADDFEKVPGKSRIVNVATGASRDLSNNVSGASFWIKKN